MKPNSQPIHDKWWNWKNISIKKKLKYIELSLQTHNTVHETKLTTYKTNHNKLWNSISNKLIVEIWNEEKKYKI
jgi:hypothetical protein